VILCTIKLSLRRFHTVIRIDYYRVAQAGILASTLACAALANCINLLSRSSAFLVKSIADTSYAKPLHSIAGYDHDEFHMVLAGAPVYPTLKSRFELLISRHIATS